MTPAKEPNEKDLSVYQALCTDLQVIGVTRPSLLRMIWCYFSTSEFTPILLYRLAAACRGHGLFGKIGERSFLRLNNLLTGCYINSGAKIGTFFHLPHPTGIIIGKATIGDHVRIFQNVTLGNRLSNAVLADDFYPTIGDNVQISAGAVLLGNIKIGNNVIVGANAVVLTDVPDNCLAVGIPARIISRE